MVNGDGDVVVERQLAGGELACLSCGGVLGGWGGRRRRCGWLRRFAGRAEAVRVFFCFLTCSRRCSANPVRCLLSQHEALSSLTQANGNRCPHGAGATRCRSSSPR